MESSGGEADKNSHILIRNNTCYFNSCSGIRVHGTMDANNAGQVTLVNNIVSESTGFGISLGDGWMCVGVTNTGYYANTVNIREFNDINSVEVNECPYVPFLWTSGCYLKQNCPFINAGLEYVEETPMIGMTTDYYNSLPDGEKTDLGFHHPNWGYWNAGLTTLRADFDNDFAVDYNDLYVLADYWLFDYDEAERDRRPDLYPDGRVNFRDFAILANEWGKTSGRHPEIVATISGDINNISGKMDIGINGYAYNTVRTFAYVDGEYIGEISNFTDGSNVQIDSSKFRNGQHNIKVVAVDPNGVITESSITNAIFNNTLHCVTASNYFEPNKPYQFACLYEEPLNIRIIAMDGNEVFNQQFTGIISVPANTLIDYGLYNVEITEGGEGEMMLLGSLGTWSQYIGKNFNQADCQTAQVLITLPDISVAQARDIAIKELETQCENKNYKILYLLGNQVAYKNLYVVFHYSDPPAVHTWYHTGNGRSYVQNAFFCPERYSLELGDGKRLFSYLKKDFLPGQVPPDYEELPGNWEEAGVTMASLVGPQEHFLQMVFIDVCYSTLYEDFAKMVGMYSDWNQSWHKNICLGWMEVVPKEDSQLFKPAQFAAHMWNRLGAGDTVYQAWYYCGPVLKRTSDKFCWKPGRQDDEESAQVRWTGR